MCDLSERDPTSIFNIFGLLPFDVPNFLIIGAWPCLMGLTMYLQQKLNPAPPDPIQAKIFMFFPLFLTVILAPFPSGLVIYWTFNNIFTMMQQVVIMRKTTVKTQIEKMNVEDLLPIDGPSINEVKKYIDKYKNDLIVMYKRKCFFCKLY